MNVIEMSGLTKYYGKARGIIDVDLNIAEGDFFGFIGPNGAGKSTTIRILLGLIRASRGNARVFGKDIVQNKTEILSDIGYLASETNFYNKMTVRETLEFSAGMRGKKCSDEASKLCERLELDTSRKVGQLSLGNRKKVGIVCALQHKPSLYILDEPTSGLDPLMQREFYEILGERNREGATVFLSSHILSEVERYCKTAAVIKDGKILASDSVHALGHTGVKRVTLRGFDGKFDISGAEDLKEQDGNTTFLYRGEPNQLIRSLADVKFDDINITDPDLEEVFMHYYEKEGK